MNLRKHYMETAPGFRARDIGLNPANPRALHFHLTWKHEAQHPRLLEMAEIRPGVWARVHDKEVSAVYQAITARVRRLIPRLERRRQWIAAQNLATVAGMTEEQARASLTARQCSALRWHEMLPHGIGPQEAADATGLDVWREWWEGPRQFVRHYQRGQRVQKFSQMAKAI